MPKDKFADFERDLGIGKPKSSRGTPWIGTETDRGGESTPAFPGTGSSLPQDIGAGGFEVEVPPDEPRDDLSAIPDENEDEPPINEFGFSSLDITPGMDGSEAYLSTPDEKRRSRVDTLDEEETSLDEAEAEEGGEMGISAEISEFPIGAEDISPGEMGRYQCPNCGFEYDVVVGTSARCPQCNYEADLTTIVGDEAFHTTMDAAELEE